MEAHPGGLYSTNIPLRRAFLESKTMAPGPLFIATTLSIRGVKGGHKAVKEKALEMLRCMFACRSVKVVEAKKAGTTVFIALRVD